MKGRAGVYVSTIMEKGNKAHTTVQPEVIKAWTEERGGKPARVRKSGAKHHSHFSHEGLLRIDFNTPEDRLEPITWQDFFAIFDEHKLAFLFQEETADGNVSRFYKFVERK